MTQYRPQWHPNCTHAEHRGRLAPLACDFHRCGVKGKDLYNERNCEGCASRSFENLWAGHKWAGHKSLLTAGAATC